MTPNDTLNDNLIFRHILEIIYIDIDETICYYDESRNYNLALPIKENIKKNNLISYD